MAHRTPESSSVRSVARAKPPFWRSDFFLITLLGLLSLVLFLVFYDQAFPSAAIDLELSRAEIAQRGRDYLASHGYETDDYEFALTFTGDFWASVYLQRVLGIPETNRLIEETGLPIWYWRARWFRPLQKEEFQVYASPDGRVVAFSHTLLEDAPGASIAQDEARALAEQYLSRDQGWDLVGWEEVSASSEDRPGGRTDHTFVWKRDGWDVGESELRLAVTVKGDEVGRYVHWLKVPEAFQRDFAQQRNVAGFINSLSLAASLGLFFLLLALALWKAGGRVPASFSFAIVPAVAVGLVSLASRVNELGLSKAWYETTESYPLFWMGQGLGMLFVALAYGLAVFGLWFLGHWLSKQSWPRRDRILARRGDRWRLLARSGWRGVMLGLMNGGYVVLFYLVATQILGGWSPMAPDYSNTYATPLPFLAALEVGLLPAMWEELMFRLLLISGVLWFLRSFTKLPKSACRLLALLVPSALWGFAHLSYIRDPFYLRGVELTLAAVLLEGFFFLRYDLVTTIVAHFVYNAGVTVLPLLRSGEPYFVASGLVVVAAMLAPVIPGAAREVRRRLRGEVSDIGQPRIRPGSPQDAEALAAFSVEGVDWGALLSDPGALVLCLEAGEQLVGVAAGRVTGESLGRVTAVYVAPPWRRQYWGSELVEDLRVRLHERGVQSIEETAHVDDKIGMNFWIAQGWQVGAVIFRWPPKPPVSPNWREALKRVFGRKGEK